MNENFFFFFFLLQETDKTIEKTIISREFHASTEIIYYAISNFRHGDYRTIYPVKFSSPPPLARRLLFFNNDLS